MPLDQAVLKEAFALVAKTDMRGFVPTDSAPSSEGAELIVPIALIDPPNARRGRTQF